MSAAAVENPFLRAADNFAPLRMEIEAPYLEIEGSLPSDLAGTYFRIGPSAQFPPWDGLAWHWFSADGMVHRIAIGNGRASYRNRWVRTRVFELEREAGRALFGTFGNPLTTDPSVAGVKWNTANTNLVFHSGRLLALEESSLPFEIKPVTLDSLGTFDFGGALAGPMTAHPKLDPETGELVSFAYTEGSPFTPDFVYRVIDRDGRIVRDERFEAPIASMMHDFGITRTRTILPFLPVVFELPRALAGGNPIVFDPTQRARIGVLGRHGSLSDIRWCETEPCYVFHGANAYDDGDRIVWDVIAYREPPLVDRLSGGFPPVAETPGRLERWTLEPEKGSIQREPLNALPGEPPRIDERLTATAHRHLWYATQSRAMPQAPMYDGIAHVDVGLRTTQAFIPADGRVFGEPMFVPRRDDAAEGDGYVLSLAYLPESRSSALHVFEALRIEAGPIARIHLDHRVPNGHHGFWLGRSSV